MVRKYLFNQLKYSIVLYYKIVLILLLLKYIHFLFWCLFSKKALAHIFILEMQIIHNITEQNRETTRVS